MENDMLGERDLLPVLLTDSEELCEDCEKLEVSVNVDDTEQDDTDFDVV
jgi:hypothetical protein